MAKPLESDRVPPKKQVMSSRDRVPGPPRSPTRLVSMLLAPALNRDPNMNTSVPPDAGPDGGSDDVISAAAVMRICSLESLLSSVPASCISTVVNFASDMAGVGHMTASPNPLIS